MSSIAFSFVILAYFDLYRRIATFLGSPAREMVSEILKGSIWSSLLKVYNLHLILNSILYSYFLV